MVHIDCAPWNLSAEWAKPIRKQVFVQEQGIDEAEEWDEADASAIHAVAWLESQAIATGRLLIDGKIGRMAVVAPYRRKGVGTAILSTLMALAKERGLPSVRLSAQLEVIDFYTKMGFKPLGEPHVEVGIAHQWMEMPLN